jgi:hypothetical protein
MLPESSPEKINRRGCIVMATLLALALLLLALLASRTADDQRANEVTSEGSGSNSTP